MTTGAQPAFPELHIHHFQNEDAEGKHDNVVPRWMGGLTKREAFAVAALHGLLTSANNGMNRWSEREYVIAAVNLADAFIQALDQ